MSISQTGYLSVCLKKTSTIPAQLLNSKAFGDISILLKVSTDVDYEKYIKYQNKSISVIMQKLQNYICKLKKNTTKTA